MVDGDSLGLHTSTYDQVCRCEATRADAVHLTPSDKTSKIWIILECTVMPVHCQYGAMGWTKVARCTVLRLFVAPEVQKQRKIFFFEELPVPDAAHTPLFSHFQLAVCFKPLQSRRDGAARCCVIPRAGMNSRNRRTRRPGILPRQYRNECKKHGLMTKKKNQSKHRI